MRLSRIAAILLFLGATATYPVQAQTSDAAERWLYAKIKLHGMLDAPTSLLRRVAPSWFFESDLDGSGVVDAADRAAWKVVTLAKIRSEFVSRHLAHDLDGDGRVTVREVETAILPRISAFHGDRARAKGQSVVQFADAREDLKRGVADVMSADLNGDGELTMGELIQAATTRSLADLDRRIAAGQERNLPIPPLSPASGEAVTFEAYSSFVDRTLAAYDTDSNGTIGIEEMIAVARRLGDIATVKTLESRLPRK
jgi:hypothetical protein